MSQYFAFHSALKWIFLNQSLVAGESHLPAHLIICFSVCQTGPKQQQVLAIITMTSIIIILLLNVWQGRHQQAVVTHQLDSSAVSVFAAILVEFVFYKCFSITHFGWIWQIQMWSSKMRQADGGESPAMIDLHFLRPHRSLYTAHTVHTLYNICQWK